MGTQIIMEDKGLETMKSRAERLALIEKLRAMGFTEQEIEYNFSTSDKKLDMPDEDKHIHLKK